MKPRAYRYVREKFHNHLPHPQTIRQWYRNSDLDAEPGISKHSLEVLQKKAREMKENNEQLVVSLVFDEMYIQRYIMWCRSTNRFIGLISRGTPKQKEEFDLATNAIVFMACGVNAEFEQPVAYHFIQQLNYNDRANLIEEIIGEISKIGIKVANITFDGHKSNIAMCNLLGIDIKNADGEYITYFENPFDKSRVYIVFDPSHMMKLIRNNLANRSCLWNGSNEKIEWKYFEELVNYSQNHQFGLSHKMNKRHLLWEDRKMHVRTAVETLSSSSANAMEFLMNRGIENFANAAATIEFTKLFDSLWDVMNTMDTQSAKDDKNVYKTALNSENCNEIFTFLMDAKKYLLSLKVQDLKSKKIQRVVTSTVSTGFCGFVVNIISFTEMYRELVEEKHWLRCLATYRFSQDHLEMHFGKIRTLNGHNDNPNAQQFCSAYRKLLFEADLVLSDRSNVEARCISNVLKVSSSSSRPKKCAQMNPIQIDEELADIDPDPLDFEMEVIIELLDDNTCDPGIAYVANELELRLKRCKQIYCQSCLKVLHANKKISDEICVNWDKGKPCQSTFLICQLTNSAMKMYLNTKPDFKDNVYKSVLKKVVWEEIFTEFFEGDSEEHGEDHKQFLVKFFIDEYINVTCAHTAKQITIATQKQYLRKRLMKLIHFHSQ